MKLSEALTIPRTEVMEVKDVIWEYSMDIEKYQTVNESDWDLPEGGRLKRTAREIHHYESVLDHYETKTRQVSEQVLVGYEEKVVGYRDLGNGYFEEITQQVPKYETRYKTETYQEPVYRSEPVYKTKYYYEIDKWLYDRTVNAMGFDRNPYWPEVELTDIERISKRKDEYFAKVVDKEGKTENISVSKEEWDRIEIGMEVVVKKWIWGSKIVFEE